MCKLMCTRPTVPATMSPNRCKFSWVAPTCVIAINADGLHAFDHLTPDLANEIDPGQCRPVEEVRRDVLEHCDDVVHHR